MFAGVQSAFNSPLANAEDSLSLHFWTFNGSAATPFLSAPDSSPRRHLALVPAALIWAASQPESGGGSAAVPAISATTSSTNASTFPSIVDASPLVTHGGFSSALAKLELSLSLHFWIFNGSPEMPFFDSPDSIPRRHLRSEER